MQKQEPGTSNIEVSALALRTDLITRINWNSHFCSSTTTPGNGGNFIDTANFYASWLPRTLLRRRRKFPGILIASETASSASEPRKSAIFTRECRTVANRNGVSTAVTILRGAIVAICGLHRLSTLASFALIGSGECSSSFLWSMRRAGPDFAPAFTCTTTKAFT